MMTLVWIGAGIGVGTVAIAGGLIYVAILMFRVHRTMLADNQTDVDDTLG